jgi:predicted transcriptional regulator
MKFVAYERVIEDLEDQGLVTRDGEEVKVTSRGEEYTRALIKQYPNIRRPRGRPRT